MAFYIASGLRPITSVLLVAVVYCLSFWRIIRRNRGNRVIECGSITLMLFFLMMFLMQVKNLPDYVLPSVGLLAFLLAMLTMVFWLLQGVQAIRHRRSRAEASPTASTEYGMYGLGYEPINTREKRKMRIVYWGTIILVAFLLWEYVKTR